MFKRTRLHNKHIDLPSDLLKLISQYDYYIHNKVTKINEICEGNHSPRDINVSSLWKNSNFQKYTVCKSLGNIIMHNNIVTVSCDSKIRVWEPQTGECLLCTESDPVKRIFISPTNNNVHLCLHNGDVNIYNLVTQSFKCIPTSILGSCFDVSLTGEVLIGLETGYKIWNFVTSIFVSTPFRIAFLCNLPNNKIFIVTEFGNVGIFKKGDYKCDFLLYSLKGVIQDVYFTSTHKLLIICDISITILDLMDDSFKGILEGHTNTINGVTEMPDSRIASVSNDKTLRIWNLETLECELIYIDDEPLVGVLAFDNIIMVYTQDHKLKIID